MKRSSNQYGGVFVVMLLLVPVFVAVLLLVVDIALRVNAKLALQIAADRAVYAAAKDLAETTLKKIAEANWGIHKEFSETKNYLEKINSKDKEASAQSKFNEAKNEIENHKADMTKLVRDGYIRACEVALAEAKRWAPHAKMQPLYGRVRIVEENGQPRCVGGDALFGFGEDDVEEEQKVDVTACWPETAGGGPLGGTFDKIIEPKSEAVCVSEELLSYRVWAPTSTADGSPTPKVAFAVRLEQEAPASLLPQLFDYRPRLRAAAAAQPYGGSIKETAFIEAGSEEEAYAKMPYKPTLVPLATLWNGAEGYSGLWNCEERPDDCDPDDTPYLH